MARSESLWNGGVFYAAKLGDGVERRGVRVTLTEEVRRLDLGLGCVVGNGEGDGGDGMHVERVGDGNRH